MTAHQWFIEHRADLATRTLDPGDESKFRDHLSRCEECRVAVAGLERELAWLPMGAEPVVPPPGFRHQALDRALGTHRSAWRIPLGLAAAAVMAAGGGLWWRGQARETRLASELVRSRQAFAALSDTVAVLRRAARVLHASVAMNDHQGSLVIFADNITHRWNVVFQGLPPAPAGEKYQFWFICADGMVRSAELRPSDDGTLMLTVDMPGQAGAVLGAVLSMETTTSVGNAPKGVQLAHLLL